MFRLLGAAALALAATSPALAQGTGDDNQGNGQATGNSGNQTSGPEKPAKAGNGANGSANRSARAPGAQRQDHVLTSRAQSARPSDSRDVRATAERVISRDGRQDRREDRRAPNNRWVDRDRFHADVPACPPGLAEKNNGCLPPGLARQTREGDFGYYYRAAMFGIPLSAAIDYVYYDGYLIPSASDGHYIPLLGGALSVGQIWPEGYPSLRLNDWQRDYYGFEDPAGYRYADNVIYDVDPATSAIEAVVALLSGSDFTVGERLPAGYDVYNIPSAYQDQYADSGEAMYRYADGRVYEVDPVTMLIEQAIDLVV